MRNNAAKLYNYHDALQAHIMHHLHKLENANTVANYHEYYQTLIRNGTANGAASNVFTLALFLRRHQSTQAFLPSFFPVLDLLVYVLPFLSSTWLPPLLSFISSSSLPLFKLLSSSCKLLPFYLSTFGSIEPRSSREFASISP